MSAATRQRAASCALPNKAFAAWRQARVKELAAPDSWLGLTGLFWLAPGRNRVGHAADCSVRLPGGPAYLGDLDWFDGRVFWQAAGDSRQELETDRMGQPSTVNHENWSFFLVDREGRLALRLRDLDWAKHRPVVPPGCFDYDPAWRITADWLALSLPLRMDVPNVHGELKPVEVSHKAVFAVDGQTVELLPMSVNEQAAFFVFRDRTSGKETYGAGRFLSVPAAGLETNAGPGRDGKICLDFNFAYNPPCAFTTFATCPLPPPENWLSFPVPVGERKWQGEY